jgi:hypothetical protein
MIEAAESLKDRTGEPYRDVSSDLDMPYSSLMRWRSRRKNGKPPAFQPGPKKTEPLDSTALCAEIGELRFGKYRTAGTGALLEKYRDRISRRDFNGLVQSVRMEREGAQEALERRIEWRIPGLVWGADDQDKAWMEKFKANALLVHDYGSRYAVGIHGDDTKPTGLGTALAIERMLDEAAFCPLFFKSDRGSNYISKEVQELLNERWIISLISPRHYPPYNGGVERAHQEIIRHMDVWLGAEPAHGREFRLACDVCRQEVNHKRRASLQGRTACEMFQESRPFLQAYGRRQRREAYDEIMALTFDITAELRDDTQTAAETAFRYAAETWMQLNNMICVTKNGEVLPPFYQIRSH